MFMLLIISSPLYADETGYEIELIIFEDATARYLNSEDWSYNDILRHRETAETKNTPQNDAEYKELGWKSARLKANLDRLLNNSNFKVLLNKRWKQTGLDREKSFNIPINTLNIDLVDDHESPTSSSYITGTVKLIMSRYLHFNVNIQYHRPDLDEFGTKVLKIFPVVNERRMRSKEIHYIDHPLVGIVVLATPYKIKSDTGKTKPAGYKTL